MDDFNTTSGAVGTRQWLDATEGMTILAYLPCASGTSQTQPFEVVEKPDGITIEIGSL